MCCCPLSRYATALRFPHPLRDGGAFFAALFWFGLEILHTKCGKFLKKLLQIRQLHDILA